MREHADWHRDHRGDATGILNFFLALLVGAVMTWLTDTITSPLMDTAREQGTDSVATEATSYFATFFSNQPVMFLFFSFFALVALSVFQREVLR